MEFFDLYDRTGSKLNKTIPRGGRTNPGEYHSVVHIWIQNNNGDFLIQQRNKSTDVYPYQWAPTAGAVISGESDIEAAIRETKEEVGLDVEIDQMIHLDTFYVDNVRCNYIIQLFYTKLDISLNDIKFDPIEVKAVDFKSLEEINDMIRKNTFWSYELEDIGYNYYRKLEMR